MNSEKRDRSEIFRLSGVWDNKGIVAKIIFVQTKLFEVAGFKF